MGNCGKGFRWSILEKFLYDLFFETFCMIDSCHCGTAYSYCDITTVAVINFYTKIFFRLLQVVLRDLS